MQKEEIEKIVREAAREVLGEIKGVCAQHVDEQFLNKLLEVPIGVQLFDMKRGVIAENRDMPAVEGIAEVVKLHLETKLPFVLIAQSEEPMSIYVEERCMKCGRTVYMSLSSRLLMKTLQKLGVPVKVICTRCAESGNVEEIAREVYGKIPTDEEQSIMIASTFLILTLEATAVYMLCREKNCEKACKNLEDVTTTYLTLYSTMLSILQEKREEFVRELTSLAGGVQAGG